MKSNWQVVKYAHKMANPAQYLTAFSFYCNSFEELPAKMEQEVGYKVRPKDIWTINIEQKVRDHNIFEIDRLRVVLTIIYWKDGK